MTVSAFTLVGPDNVAVFTIDVLNEKMNTAESGVWCAGAHHVKKDP